MELPGLNYPQLKISETFDSNLSRGRTCQDNFGYSRKLPMLVGAEKTSTNFLAGKDNKWDSRKRQACQSLLAKLDQTENPLKTSASDAFFVPLEADETSVFNDVTNLSPILRVKEKCEETRADKKATGYFLPLDSKSVNKKLKAQKRVNKNEFEFNLDQDDESNNKNNNRLAALKETGSCFYCGRGVNEYNQRFHNDARCKNVVREKTFLVSSKHDLSTNESWSKVSSPNTQVRKNTNMAMPKLDSKDFPRPSFLSAHTEQPPSTPPEPQRSPGGQTCRLCGKSVTRWTVDFHRTKLCQQSEMSRQRTMMILRNPEYDSQGATATATATSDQSESQRESQRDNSLEVWCPVGLRNSEELESLKNLMQAPKFVHGKDCSLCGKWFGTRSLPIHLNQCKKRFRIRNSIS